MSTTMSDSHPTPPNSSSSSVFDINSNSSRTPSPHIDTYTPTFRQYDTPMLPRRQEQNLNARVGQALRGFEDSTMRCSGLWHNLSSDIARVQQESISLDEISSRLRAAATARSKVSELQRKMDRQKQHFEQQLRNAETNVAQAESRIQEMHAQLEPQVSMLQTELSRVRQEQRRTVLAQQSERAEVSRLRVEIKNSREKHSAQIAAKATELSGVIAERDSAKASLAATEHNLDIAKTEQERLELVLRAAEETVKAMKPKEIKAWGMVSGALPGTALDVISENSTSNTNSGSVGRNPIPGPEAMAMRAGLIPPSRAALLDLLRPAAWSAADDGQKGLAIAVERHANARAAAVKASKDAEEARERDLKAAADREAKQKETEMFSVLALTRQNRIQLQELQAAQKELAKLRKEIAITNERQLVETRNLQNEVQSAKQLERESRIELENMKSKMIQLDSQLLEIVDSNESKTRETNLESQLQETSTKFRQLEELRKKEKDESQRREKSLRDSISSLKRQLATTEEDFFTTAENLRENTAKGTLIHSRRVEKLQVDVASYTQQIRDLTSKVKEEKKLASKSHTTLVRNKALLAEKDQQVQQLQSESLLIQNKLAEAVSINASTTPRIVQLELEIKRLNSLVQEQEEGIRSSNRHLEMIETKHARQVESMHLTEQQHIQEIGLAREEIEKLKSSSASELQTLRVRVKRISAAESEAMQQQKVTDDLRRQLRSKMLQLNIAHEEKRKQNFEMDELRQRVVLLKRKLEQALHPVPGAMVGSGSKLDTDIECKIDKDGSVSQAQLMSHKRKKAEIMEERRLREKAQASERDMSEKLLEAQARADELERSVHKARRQTADLRRAIGAMEDEVSAVPRLSEEIKRRDEDIKKLRASALNQEENTRKALRECAGLRLEIEDLKRAHKVETENQIETIRKFQLEVQKGKKADSVTNAILKEKLQAKTDDVNKLMITQSKLQTRMVRAKEQTITAGSKMKVFEDRIEQLQNDLNKQNEIADEAKRECQEIRSELEITQIKLKRQQERANRYRSEVREVTDEYKSREINIVKESESKSEKAIDRMKKDTEAEVKRILEQLRVSSEMSRKQIMESSKKYLNQVEKNRLATQDISELKKELEKEKSIIVVMKPELERTEAKLRQANRACEDAIERGRSAEQDAKVTIKGLSHKIDALEEDLRNCQNTLASQESQHDAEEEKMSERTAILEAEIQRLKTNLLNVQMSTNMGEMKLQSLSAMGIEELRYMLQQRNNQVEELQKELIKLRRRLAELGVVLPKPSPILGIDAGGRILTSSRNLELDNKLPTNNLKISEKSSLWKNQPSPPARVRGFMHKKAQNSGTHNLNSVTPRSKRKESTENKHNEYTVHNPNSIRMEAIVRKNEEHAIKIEPLSPHNHQVLTDNLFAAAKKGNVRGIERCLKKGIDPNVRDEGGLTPIHWAAGAGHAAAVETLLRHRKTNVDALTAARTTPLHKACWNGHLRVVQVLVNAGAEVDCGDQRKHTPLHWSIHKGHIDVVQALLDAGSKSTVCDHAGRTPLHWAAKHGRQPEAEALLAAGADKEARDNDGDTPADVGRREGYTELVELLQSSYDPSGRRRTGNER